MAVIHNEIIINAPISKIWEVLINIEELDKYDPTVKKSTALSAIKSGIGAKRKVLMLDGKNWFDEECTVLRKNEELCYELKACSFPIHNLKHTYRFQENNGQIKVYQVMEYTVKYGILGKLMDFLIIRKQSDSGIKKFFGGLKNYMENKK